MALLSHSLCLFLFVIAALQATVFVSIKCTTYSVVIMLFSIAIVFKNVINCNIDYKLFYCSHTNRSVLQVHYWIQNCQLQLCIQKITIARVLKVADCNSTKFVNYKKINIIDSDLNSACKNFQLLFRIQKLSIAT